MDLEEADMEEKKAGEESPKVFRVAQLPVSGGGGLDRRTFVKGTMAVVGAGAMMTVLGGCDDGDDDSGKCVCNTVCPCEGVGGCSCDTVVCQCQWGCECDAVSTKPVTAACLCNVESIKCKPQTEGALSPYAVWTGSVCTCNLVTPCSCNAYHPCSCNSHSSGYYISYWYPN